MSSSYGNGTSKVRQAAKRTRNKHLIDSKNGTAYANLNKGTQGRRAAGTPKDTAYVQFCKRAKRPIELAFTEDLFNIMMTKPCHYCDLPVQGGYCIDRMDPDGNYTVLNCVPCCASCNSMKSSIPYDVFIAQCKRVAANRYLYTTSFQNLVLSCLILTKNFIKQ